MMQTRSKPVSVRFTLDNWEWLRAKSKDKRGKMACLVELAVTEMRQGMEGKATRSRKAKESIVEKTEEG